MSKRSDGSEDFVEVVSEDRTHPTEHDPVEPSPTVLIVLGLAIVLVAGGALVTYPGLGVLLLVCGSIPLARTVLVVRRRAQAGRETSNQKTVGMFLLSSLITGAMIWFLSCAVLMAGMAALFAICITGLAVGPAANDELFAYFIWSVVGMAILTTIGFGGWTAWKIARVRYEKDIKRD